MHIYPHGSHGLSLVSHETLWSVSQFRRKYDWLSRSVEWLVDLFDLKYGSKKLQLNLLQQPAAKNSCRWLL